MTPTTQAILQSVATSDPNLSQGERLLLQRLLAAQVKPTPPSQQAGTPEGEKSGELLSLRAAARRLNISLRGIYRLVASQQLPHPVKVGGSSKFFEADIQAYLEVLRSQRN